MVWSGFWWVLAWLVGSLVVVGCDSHTSHVDKKCINTAGALIIELRRLYNHRITQTNRPNQPTPRPKKAQKTERRYQAEHEFGWCITFESIVALVLGLETRRHRRGCQRRLQIKTTPPRQLGVDKPSDVFEYIRLSLVGSVLGVFGERVSVLSIRDRSRIFSIG